MLLNLLIERGKSGHGGGVVIGKRRPEEKVGSAHKFMRPWPSVTELGEALLPLLNPDGAVLMTKTLRVEATGYVLRAKPKRRPPGTGSRHAALLAATEDVDAVAIAISDDGGVTVFGAGKIVARVR